MDDELMRKAQEQLTANQHVIDLLMDRLQEQQTEIARLQNELCQ